jgi:hypothetical protein
MRDELLARGLVTEAALRRLPNPPGSGPKGYGNA